MSSPDQKDAHTYELISRLTNDLLWVWDVKTNRIERMPGLKKAFGYYGTKIYNDTDWWISHIHPDDRERVTKSMEKALHDRKQTIWADEFRFLHKNGKYVYVQDKAYISRDKKGMAIQALGAIRDISQRKENEENLQMRVKLEKATADLGQQALSNLDLPIFLQQAATQLHTVLDVEFTKILELLPGGEEMILRAGVGWNDHIMIDSSRVSAGKDSHAGYTMLTNQPVIMEDLQSETRFRDYVMLTDHQVRSGMSVILYGKDGPYGALGVHTTKKRIFTHDDIEYLQSVANIISLAIQRHQIEKELSEAQSQFKALYDANIIGVMFERIDGQMIKVNNAFLQMIGYTREEFEKNPFNWRKLTPPEFAEIDKKAEEQVVTSGIAPPYEKEYIRKDGSRVPVIIGAVRMKEQSGEVIAFALDISERKELEIRKDEFMSIASHELKTPLTSIKGYTQILERIIHQMGDEQLNTYLQRTNLYIDRLNNLIAELLDISKIQAGKLIMNDEEFAFDDFVNESIESIQHLTSRHTIKKKGSVKVTIKGDRNRLEQVLSNLLSNAIKYSPKGERIDVTVRRKKDMILTAVRDYGIGISKKDQKSLFSRFYRVESASKKFSGLGIGLYISSEIVKRHGGRMWVKSNNGSGSTFYFTLPLSHA